MKYLIITLLIGLSMAQKLTAQGFQGKRFSTSYEGGASFLGRTFVWDRFLLFRHSADVNFALSKRFTFGIGVNYAHKTLPEGSKIIALADQERIIFNNDQYGDFENATISDFTYVVKMRYYAKKNGCFAPIGSYFGLSYETGKQNTLRSFSENGETLFAYDDFNRKKLQVISLTFGRNIILQKRIVIGYGMAIGYNLTRHNQFRRHIARPFVNLGIIF